MSEPIPDRSDPETRLQAFFTAAGMGTVNRIEFEKEARFMFRTPGHEEIVEKVCLDHLDTLTDLNDRGLCQRTLGLVFMNEDPNRAVEYFQQAEGSYLEADDITQVMGTLHALTETYAGADRWPDALRTVSREAGFFVNREMELGPLVEAALDSLEDNLLESLYRRKMTALIQMHCVRGLSGEIHPRREARLMMWFGTINSAN